MLRKLREHLKNKYRIEGRAVTASNDLAGLIFHWQFESAFKALVFSIHDTWYNLLLFYSAAVCVGDQKIKKLWYWHILPRWFGHMCAWWIGYRYDIDLDELIQKETDEQNTHTSN